MTIRYSVENDVGAILVNDGIENNVINSQSTITNINKILKDKGFNEAWSHRIINTESNSATLIYQPKGEGNRLHFHPDFDEWWYIVSGEWVVEIGTVKIIAVEDDFVLINRGTLHRITAVGDKPSVRLAVNKDMVKHIYKEGGEGMDKIKEIEEKK